LAPEVVLAQAGHESNWGKSTPGNNFFGIKGTGGTYQTTEIITGQAQTANASFAGYQTSADSFAGFGDLMLTKRYSRVASAGDYPAQIQAIAAAGYATDPNYARKVTAAADKVHGIISTL
jgi:flagellum-specific peptidoglycan hydrolase FlgJ